MNNASLTRHKGCAQIVVLIQNNDPLKTFNHGNSVTWVTLNWIWPRFTCKVTVQGHRFIVSDSLASNYSNVENWCQKNLSWCSLNKYRNRYKYHQWLLKSKNVKMGCIPRDNFRYRKISVIFLLVLNLLVYAGNYPEIWILSREPPLILNHFLMNASDNGHGFLCGLQRQMVGDV